MFEPQASPTQNMHMEIHSYYVATLTAKKNMYMQAPSYYILTLTLRIFFMKFRKTHSIR